MKTGAEAADRAVQNGASPEESILYGTGLALANYAVGRLPVEKLSSLMQAGEETEAKSILADYLKQAGVSAGKSYLKNAAGCSMTSWSIRRFPVGQYQQELMKNRMEEEAALRKARENITEPTPSGIPFTADFWARRRTISGDEAARN